MAVKTITIDMEAYEALRRHKGAGQSFSDVIKEHLGGKTTGQALRRVVSELGMDDEAIDAIDRLVAERGSDPADAPAL